MKYSPLLLICLLLTCPVLGQEQAAGEPAPTTEIQDSNDTVFGNVLNLQQSISATTGMAFSPLLGMGVLGVWQYLKATPEQRADLPWYTHPWVWGICLGIFLMATLKDTAGIAVPEALKKPLAVLDVLEDKLSATIVALAVIPVSVASKIASEDGPDAMMQGAGGGPLFAVLPLAGIPLMIVLLLAVFATVWMVSHAFKCLLLLSPSSFITAGVKALKGAFLACFVVVAAYAPWLGFALSMVILVICVLISGWAFRWNVFGTLFVWDFFSSSFDKQLEQDEPVTGFSKIGVAGVKPRSYGELCKEADRWVFRYRPWLLFPRRDVVIPLEGVRTGLRKGLISPSLTAKGKHDLEFQTVLETRLRFRSHEDELAARFAVDERQPSRVIQGAKSAVAWVRDQIRGDLGLETQRPEAVA